MWPFMLFLVAVLVAAGLIGSSMSGLFSVTVLAAVCLALIVAVGAWTMTRQRKHL